MSRSIRSNLRRSNVKVLQVVKTLNGAHWAAWQVAQLVRLGVEVDVALPAREGLYLQDWVRSGARLHFCDLDYPIIRPWTLPTIYSRVRKLVDEVKPDLIHSHFVGTTLSLRKGLGKGHTVPRLFQVPGPLHLEHAFFRNLELSSAGPNDYWIASSKYTQNCLVQSGIPASRLFLSYYGWCLDSYSVQRSHVLRTPLDIPRGRLVVGNISWLYPPKWHLGQKVGLKCHEDLIEALGLVLKERSDVVGVLAGGQFGGRSWYEERLRSLAQKIAGDRIKMPGRLAPEISRSAWPDFDCAIHAPLSENCGGVMEPLYATVPTVAARVGGIPEVVIDGLTGKTVAPRRPPELAAAVLTVLEDLPKYKSMARTGHALVSTMFDVSRTASEVFHIYRHVLDPSRNVRPVPFDSSSFSAQEQATAATGILAPAGGLGSSAAQCTRS